jgi:hypothetical protein
MAEQVTTETDREYAVEFMIGGGWTRFNGGPYPTLKMAQNVMRNQQSLSWNEGTRTRIVSREVTISKTAWQEEAS